MTSFLSKKRDEKSYEEILATIPEQTRRNKLYAIKVFEDFVRENYNKTIQDVIEELQMIRKTKDQDVYDEAGSYILLGAIYPGNTFTLDSSEIITKCLQIFGCHNYDTIYLKQALDLVITSRNHYPFKKLVGPSFDFSPKGLENAFKSLESKTAIRPCIYPSL